MSETSNLDQISAVIADQLGLATYLTLKGVRSISARKAAERYIKVHLIEYFSTIRNTYLFTINSTTLYNGCGKISIKGKQQRTKVILDKYKPFFIIDELGNNIKQQLSSGYLNGEYKNHVENITHDQQEEIIKMAEHTDNPTFQTLTPIHFDSLKRAIQDGLVGKQDNSTELTNIQIDMCKRFVNKMNDYGEIQTDYVQNKTGRLYATNTNLQNAPKVVRRAVMGSYKLLDFNSACFSVIYQIASNFKEYPKLWQYVNNAESYRLKIATEITNQYRIANHKERLKKPLSNTSEIYKNVKTAFTSIGFGAKTTVDSCWYENGKLQETAVKSALGVLAPYFIKHVSVHKFVHEFNEAMELVYTAFYAEGDLEIYPGVTIDRTQSKSKQYATIYQSLERQLLDILVDQIPQENLLLLLHDGVAVTKNTQTLDIMLQTNNQIKDKFRVISSTGEDYEVISNKCFITLSTDLID